MTGPSLTEMMSEEDFLAHMDFDNDDTLEQSGVKGMKWGQRKASSAPKLGPDGAPAKTRKELRGLDRASAKKDRTDVKDAIKKERDDRDNSIDAARARINSGELKTSGKDAKATFKNDRQLVGKREARKALNAVKEKNWEDAMLANEAKSGRETVTKVITEIAGYALLGVLSGK